MNKKCCLLPLKEQPILDWGDSFTTYNSYRFASGRVSVLDDNRGIG
jgi:hypothetical protein